MRGSAILHTGYLPFRLIQNLAFGLEARWLDLLRDRHASYGGDATRQTRADLISDARQAYALGLISYLPTWAQGDHPQP